MSDQYVLLIGPDQAFHKQEKEYQHGEGFSQGKASEGDGERQKKDSFDIEDEKNNAVEVVAGLELDPGIPFGLQPALIDGILAQAGFVRGEFFLPKSRPEAAASGRTRRPRATAQ